MSKPGPFDPFVVLLREERERRKLSLSQLERKSGIARASMSQWENFIHRPALPELRRWAASLGYRITLEMVPEETPPSVDELLGAIGVLSPEQQRQLLTVAQALGVADDKDRKRLTHWAELVLEEQAPPAQSEAQAGSNAKSA